MLSRLSRVSPSVSSFAARGSRAYSTSLNPKDVVIVSTARTPIGSFGGALASVSGTQLQAVTVKAVLERAGVKPEEVTECLIGNVLSANLGQAPARQAAIFGGLKQSTVCTTINKVCSSGMKAVMYGAQSITLGDHDVVVAGGFESMSQVPYYLDKARNGYRLGNGNITDGLLKDGLTDVYNQVHMGIAGEDCAKRHNLSRKEQDDYAILSYKRAATATEKGYLKAEIVGVPVPQSKGDPVMVTEDEEFKKTNFDKIPSLKPVFQKDGTITAANASKLNDGACSLLLMSAEKAKALGVTPLAVIRGYADAEHDPIQFPTAPALAAPKALKKAGLQAKDIDYWEFSEAFSTVPLANSKLLNIDINKMNVHGGAVSLGHPLGCSGARLTAALVHILKQYNGKYGCAAICNGGGGASAIVIERVM